MPTTQWDCPNCRFRAGGPAERDGMYRNCPRCGTTTNKSVPEGDDADEQQDNRTDSRCIAGDDVDAAPVLGTRPGAEQAPADGEEAQEEEGSIDDNQPSTVMWGVLIVIVCTTLACLSIRSNNWWIAGGLIGGALVGCLLVAFGDQPYNYYEDEDYDLDDDFDDGFLPMEGEADLCIHCGGRYVAEHAMHGIMCRHCGKRQVK